MLCTTSTYSGPDSFHTAQEGSIECLCLKIGSLQERDGRAEEVTSRVSMQKHSIGHPSSTCSSQGLQPLSDPVSRRWSLAAEASQRRPSRAPICVFSRRAAGLRRVPLNMLPAHKRLCAAVLSSQQTMSIIPASQDSASAVLEDHGKSLPAAGEQDHDTPCIRVPASPEDGEGAVHVQADAPQQPAKNSAPPLDRLEAGASSPPCKDTVHGDGLQTKSGYAQPTEHSAMSRRRLSFFAQLPRPKQVQPHPSSSKRRRDASEEGIVQQQCAAQEQRQAHHRFRQAYVNAQLAEQWAAGQPWAELDATGVPWSAEAAATAEHDWRELSASMEGGQASNDLKREAERAWDALRTIRMRHCSSRTDICGAAAIKGILKPAEAGHERTAGHKRQPGKVRIQDGS